MTEKTIETEDRSGRIETAKDAIGETIGAAGQFLSDRVLSPIGAGAAPLAPAAEKAMNCAARTVRGSADAVAKVGGATRDVVADGLTTGHRVLRKVPGVARVEDTVSAAVKAIPDRLNLVRADDIADLKRSIDALNRQIDRLVENTSG